MRAFILGDSGEILDHDISLLKGEVVFGTNIMALRHPDVLTHYVCGDIVMAFVPEVRARVPKGVKKYYSRLMWNTIDHEDDVNVYDGLDKRLGCEASTERVYGGTNVGFVALQIAMGLGFNPIYTLGIDLGLPANGVEYIPEYKEFRKLLKSKNLKNPMNDKRVDRSKDKSLYERNRGKKLMFFQLAKEKAKELGIEIINLSQGGKLNMFPRESFNNVVNSNLMARAG